jgi:hypothetical protein
VTDLSRAQVEADRDTVARENFIAVHALGKQNFFLSLRQFLQCGWFIQAGVQLAQVTIAGWLAAFAFEAISF